MRLLGFWEVMLLRSLISLRERRRSRRLVLRLQISTARPYAAYFIAIIVFQDREAKFTSLSSILSRGATAFRDVSRLLDVDDA